MDSFAVEQRIRLVAEGTASATGEDFFHALARALAAVCGTRYAMVGALRGPCEVEVLALWNGDAVEHGLRYELLGTPSEVALADRFFVAPQDVAAEFPEDPLLRERSVDSYIGVALVAADGELLGVLCAFHDRPLPDEANDPALLRIFASRAAAELERVQIQAALEESEALTRGILESTPDAILAVSPSGSIEFANGSAYEMFGRTPEDGWDVSIDSLIPALRVDGSTGQSLELEGRGADGSRFPAAVTVSELDSGCRPLQTLVVRNISQRRVEERQLREYATALENTNADLERARRAAEEGARTKSDFLANMSHEIRTPMTAILGFAEILLEEGAIPDEHRDSLRTIRRNGAYLLEILNDVLDFSKIESNRLEIETIPCSPLRIVAEVEDLMRIRSDQKRIELRLELDGQIPESILTDPIRLRQILLNLIGNAIKFTETGAVSITLRYRESLRLLEFEVADTGVGIPANQLDKIFEPFSQADESTTRRFGGTGLGLAISKRLTELMGGQIDAHSIVGRGSVFRFRLPIGAVGAVPMVDEIDDPETQSAVQLRERVEQTRLRGRVLVVEDGPDNQRIIRHILERAGCEVALADDGQAGLNAALAACEAEAPYDVILMDVQMPVVDGYEATRRLRAQGYAGPIIALTAHAMASERQRAVAAGCDDFATKPIDRFKLLELLGGYLGEERTKPPS